MTSEARRVKYAVVSNANGLIVKVFNEVEDAKTYLALKGDIFGVLTIATIPKGSKKNDFLKKSDYTVIEGYPND